MVMYAVISTSRFLCIYFLLTTGLTRRISADTNNATIDCSFDEDFCDWTHDIKYGFNWTRHSGPTETDNTGPPGDHTNEDGKGYYIYIDSSEKINQSKTARLLSPEIDSGCFNVQFWYHMYGWGIGTLKVNCEPKCNGLEYKKTRGTQWIQAKINVSMEQEFMFVIEATTKSGHYSQLGDIAVDDFHVTRFNCPIDCVFNKTLCTWKNLNSSQHNDITFNWAYSSTGGQNHLYVMVGKTAGNAVLKSIDQLSGMSCVCVKLDINGTGNNTLNVKIQENGLHKRNISSFHRYSDKRCAEITSNVTYQILLEAYRENGTYDNILLYNVSSTEGSCTRDDTSNPCSHGGPCTQGPNTENTTPYASSSSSEEFTESSSSIASTTEHSTSSLSLSSTISEIGLSLMYIAIISAGSLVALVILIVVVVCLCRRKKRRYPVKNSNNSAKDTDTPNDDDAYDMAVYEQCGPEQKQNDERREQHDNENEYSVAKNVHIVNDSGADGGDIYNHINQGSVKPIPDENYSHLPTLNQNQTSVVVDETYSHLANPNPSQMKGAYINDTTYSHTPVVNKGRKQQIKATIRDDDNYDALNSALNTKAAGKSTQDNSIHDSEYDHI
ncbi:hypothetical protein ACF0H5_007866 [Mactra antiquata]